jgi:hypothetical protein
MFQERGVVLLGSIRRDGTPRISPLEAPFVVRSELLLGMMWRSKKALDLLRDPRCLLHSAPADASGADGEFKLYGRAREIDDAAWRAEYFAAAQERIPEVDPDAPAHVFAFDLEQAWFQRVYPDPVLLGWPRTARAD